MHAVVAIERDLDATFSLPELADHACLSPFHFHRLFTAVVGEPPAEYVRRLRLERAAHELSTSHRAVADIGRAAASSRSPRAPAMQSRHRGYARSSDSNALRAAARSSDRNNVRA